MLSLDQLAIDMCVSFAVNQLAAYGASVNWGQAQTQLDSHLKAVIHEAWLEGAVQSMADAVYGVMPAICKNADDVKQIIDAAEAGDVPTAVKTLKGLAVKLLPASGEYTTELTQLLQAA